MLPFAIGNQTRTYKLHTHVFAAAYKVEVTLVTFLKGTKEGYKLVVPGGKGITNSMDRQSTH